MAGAITVHPQRGHPGPRDTVEDSGDEGRGR
jgi:hypothetical protein